MIDRIVNTGLNDDIAADPVEQELENTLRPRDFANYIGQDTIKAKSAVGDCRRQKTRRAV